jgi:hypothetical protein
LLRLVKASLEKVRLDKGELVEVRQVEGWPVKLHLDEARRSEIRGEERRGDEAR